MKKLDIRGDYKATTRLPKELCELINKNFTGDLSSLIRDALYHFLTCSLADYNGKAQAIMQQRSADVYEARLTRLEKIARITE